MERKRIDNSYLNETYGIDPCPYEDCSSSHFVNNHVNKYLNIQDDVMNNSNNGGVDRNDYSNNQREMMTDSLNQENGYMNGNGDVYNEEWENNQNFEEQMELNNQNVAVPYFDDENFYVENLGSMSPEKLRYLNSFLQTQIGKRVKVEFLLGLNNLVNKEGTLIVVGNNYILLGDIDNEAVTACNFKDIKFIRFE